MGFLNPFSQMQGDYLKMAHILKSSSFIILSLGCMYLLDAARNGNAV
jgi:hypothetical protein